jgi:hypothetical protein
VLMRESKLKAAPGTAAQLTPATTKK